MHKNSIAMLQDIKKKQVPLELKDIECCVCLTSMQTLMHNTCGHDICQSCVRQLLLLSDFRCPICRQETLLKEFMGPKLGDSPVLVDSATAKAINPDHKMLFCIKQVDQEILRGHASILCLAEVLRNFECFSNLFESEQRGHYVLETNLIDDIQYATMFYNRNGKGDFSVSVGCFDKNWKQFFEALSYATEMITKKVIAGEMEHVGNNESLNFLL